MGIQEMVLIDYDYIVVDRPDLDAVLFNIMGSEVWIPRSLIEDIWEEDGQVEISLWFAEKEGLV